MYNNIRNNQFDEKYFTFQSLIFSLNLKSIFNLASNLFVNGDDDYHGLILNFKCCIWFEKIWPSLPSGRLFIANRQTNSFLPSHFNLTILRSHFEPIRHWNFKNFENSCGTIKLICNYVSSLCKKTFEKHSNNDFESAWIKYLLKIRQSKL